MWIFNRLVVILLLAGLLALGISIVVSAIGIPPYDLTNLPGPVQPDNLASGARGYLQNIENGAVGLLDLLVLGGLILLGLLLLILELKPPAPRRVRMQRGTYTTRGAVKNEVDGIVSESADVLESNVNVKAQRSSGAKVDIRGSVRAGEDAQGLQSGLQGRVERGMAEKGIPVGSLRVRLREADPRGTGKRVQ